jgi:hypothetical protein
MIAWQLPSLGGIGAPTAMPLVPAVEEFGLGLVLGLSWQRGGCFVKTRPRRSKLESHEAGEAGEEDEHPDAGAQTQQIGHQA